MKTLVDDAAEVLHECILQGKRRVQESQVFDNEDSSRSASESETLKTILFQFNSNLAKDEPTGQTPMRRTYPFPKVLSRTSPHERILERRHRTLTGSSKIPLPNLDEDLSPVTTTGSLQNLSCNSDASEGNSPDLPGLQRVSFILCF